jgi:hypothetical protein
MFNCWPIYPTHSNFLHWHLGILLLCIIIISYLHDVSVNNFQIHFYIGLCKCFEVCKCINYIPWMIIPSCKSMLISCECIVNLNFIFCNGPLSSALHKKSWYFDIIQTLAFFLRIWDNGDTISRNIFNAHCAPSLLE